MRVRWRIGFTCWTVIALLGALLPVAPIRSAPATDIDGNTYTSPTFGYTITWGDAWFVVAEESDAEGDYLALTNATTVAAFGGFAGPNSPAECIDFLASGLGVYGEMDDIAPLTGDDGSAMRGGNGERAFAAFAGTTMLADGTTIAMAAFLDCRTIVPGESLLSLIAFLPREAFADQLPLIEALLAGIVIPGAGQRSAGTDDGDEPELDEAHVLGEPAPVFVTRRWRVAIATTVRDREIAIAGLEPRADQEWFVVIADVTNWSDEDGTFVGEELGLHFAGDTPRVAPDPGSSRAAARALDLERVDLAAGVEIDAGETVRLALVFLVPEEEATPVLHGLVSEPGLPLDDERDEESLRELPPLATAPALRPVQVVEAIDGEVVELRLAGSAATIRARLIGVDAPAKGECYADWSRAQLTSLVGERAWIEGDPAERGGLTERVYLWAEHPLGHRVLVNQRQVADGYAEARDLGEEARFAAWIAETGRTAQANRAGLWGNCDGVDDSARATTAPVPPPASSPDLPSAPGSTPTPTPEPLPTVVTIEVFDFGYRPARVTIPAGTDVTITVANTGEGDHTFTIDELAVSISIPPGERETFTLNLPAGEYVFYCEQPGHRPDGMEGVLVVE